MSNKFFLGLGVVTVLSGVGLILMKSYVIGIAGLFTGALLIYQNFINKEDSNTD